MTFSAEQKLVAIQQLAEMGGTIDGEHHKQWAFDQIMRVILDCPVVTKKGIDCNGIVYEYESLGESKRYEQWALAMQGEWDEGSEDYEYPEWEVGIPP